MGILHPATFKALGHLLWLWRGLKFAKKVMWGQVIQTDLVTWSFMVESYDLRIMCKKDEGIVLSNFAAIRTAIFSLFTENLRGARIKMAVSDFV